MLLLVGFGGCGDASEVSVIEVAAVTLHGDDVGVVDEVVDHDGCDDIAAEDFAPAPERFVRGDDQAGLLVAGREE